MMDSIVFGIFQSIGLALEVSGLKIWLATAVAYRATQQQQQHRRDHI